MTRDTRRGLLIAVASGLAAGAILAAGRADGAVSQRPMRVVAQESQVRGWPHAPSAREAHAVAYTIARSEILPGEPGAVLCRATRGTMGFWVCGVRVFRQDGSAEWSYRVAVRVWEDGSWRSSYPGRGR